MKIKHYCFYLVYKSEIFLEINILFVIGKVKNYIFIHYIFIDSVISQMWIEFITKLLLYNKILYFWIFGTCQQPLTISLDWFKKIS